MMKSTCEKIIMPVSKNTKTEMPILNRNRKNTVPSRFTVFVTVRLVFPLSSISALTAFSLSSPLFSLGLADRMLSMRSSPIASVSVSPNCRSSHGCFTWMENRLSRMSATLFPPLLSASGRTIFVPTERLAVLTSSENSFRRFTQSGA